MLSRLAAWVADSTINLSVVVMVVMTLLPESWMESLVFFQYWRSVVVRCFDEIVSISLGSWPGVLQLGCSLLILVCVLALI